MEKIFSIGFRKIFREIGINFADKNFKKFTFFKKFVAILKFPANYFECYNNS